MWNALPPTLRVAALAILIPATLLLGFYAGPRLDGKALTPRIGRFELAWSGQCSKAILEKWGKEGRAAAVRSLRFDNFFIAAYALLLCLLCGWGTTVFPGSSPWARVGQWLAWGALVAGVLDWIENVALVSILTRAASGIAGEESIAPAAHLAAVCAGVKFLLAGLGVIYVLIALIVWLIQLFEHTSASHSL